MNYLVPVILLWVACGVLGHGLMFGYFQRAYREMSARYYWSDFAGALIAFIFGPIGLIVALNFVFLTSIHGYQGFKWL